MTKERFTWYELKKFCSTLTGEQLGYEVKAWGENKAFTLKGVELLEDDFINPSGEGCEPISMYKDEPDILKDEKVIYHKKQPILNI